MKVLQVINNLTIGGAEVLLRDLVPRLRYRGIDVSVAPLNLTGSHLERELLSIGVPFLSNNQCNLYSPRNILWLARQLQKFDIVHAHLFPTQLWVAMASCLFGKKRTILVTTEHSTYNRRRIVCFRPFDRWMYSKYLTIICISNATALTMTKWIPDIARKITIIPNGINLEKFRTARASNKSKNPQTPPVVLSIGRLEPQKDHATVLRAIEKLPDVQLIMVGDGKMRLQLERLAFSLGISNRVHFLGERHDIPELMQMADVYVQSSCWEGFGIAALEAMAGGLPVVSSNVPGLSDVVGSAGMLFPPGDNEALATVLSTLLFSAELRKDLSLAGMEKAREYSIDKTADLYVDLYRNCAMD